MSFLKHHLRRETPARLEPKMSLRETYEVELIFLAGVGVIILLFLFAFMFVGQMDPIHNGGLI